MTSHLPDLRLATHLIVGGVAMSNTQLQRRRNGQCGAGRSMNMSVEEFACVTEGIVMCICVIAAADV
jgi:hypothetical protein